MKTLFQIIILLILNLNVFSQNLEKEETKIIFFDKCSNKIINVKYKIFSNSESKNKPFLSYLIERGDWTTVESTKIDLNQQLDTIKILKILLFRGKDKQWTFLNCNKICNGIETDYYENEKKRIEGNFVNGKPKEIKNYQKNGTLKYQKFYNLGTLNYKRVNYFNNSGKLLEYEIYQNKKRKTIIKLFDKKGKLKNRKVRRQRRIERINRQIVGSKLKNGQSY